jgi:magnesium transporter
MLVNCVAYREGRKLSDIPVETISDHLKEPGCFVWVALRDPDLEEFEVMRREFNLNQLAVEDALTGHQRPQIEEHADSLFVVLQLIEPAGDELRVGEVDVFVGDNYVLSVRRSSTQTFLGVRQRCEREPHLLKLGPAFVLYALIDQVVDRYFPIVDALEVEIEEIEERIFAGRSKRDTIERLYALKRKALTLHHAALPLMQALGRLHGGRVPQICVGTQEYFRDVQDHVARVDAAIDKLRDSIATAIQVNLSLVAVDTNEVAKQLAAWAGIFGAATAFAGIWGMNFENMPELKWAFGYPMALATIVGACALLFWRFRRAGWL